MTEIGTLHLLQTIGKKTSIGISRQQIDKSNFGSVSNFQEAIGTNKSISINNIIFG